MTQFDLDTYALANAEKYIESQFTAVEGIESRANIIVTGLSGIIFAIVAYVITKSDFSYDSFIKASCFKYAVISLIGFSAAFCFSFRAIFSDRQFFLPGFPPTEWDADFYITQENNTTIFERVLLAHQMYIDYNKDVIVKKRRNAMRAVYVAAATIIINVLLFVDAQYILAHYTYPVR